MLLFSGDMDENVVSNVPHITASLKDLPNNYYVLAYYLRAYWCPTWQALVAVEVNVCLECCQGTRWFSKFNMFRKEVYAQYIVPGNHLTNSYWAWQGYPPLLNRRLQDIAAIVHRVKYDLCPKHISETFPRNTTAHNLRVKENSK